MTFVFFYLYWFNYHITDEGPVMYSFVVEYEGSYHQNTELVGTEELRIL